MRDSLMQPSAEAALRLLPSRFAGHLEDVELPERDETLADFLTAEGIVKGEEDFFYYFSS